MTVTVTMKRELSRDTAGREGNTCNSEDQGEVGVVKAAKLVEHATASASTSASDNASLQSSTSHNHHSGPTGSISSTGSDGVVTSGSGSGSGSVSKSTAATTPPKLLYFLIHKPREVLSDRIDSQVTSYFTLSAHLLLRIH